MPFTDFEGPGSGALEGGLEDNGGAFGALEDSDGGDYVESSQYEQSGYNGSAPGSGFADQGAGYDDAAQQELSMEEMMADDAEAAPEDGTLVGKELAFCVLLPRRTYLLRSRFVRISLSLLILQHDAAALLDDCLSRYLCLVDAGAAVESHGATLLQAAANACGEASSIGMRLQASQAARSAEISCTGRLQMWRMP